MDSDEPEQNYVPPVFRRGLQQRIAARLRRYHAEQWRQTLARRDLPALPAIGKPANDPNGYASTQAV
jgi:hypothetical protein